MSRVDDLLTAAAEVFDDGRDPFTDAFLVEHKVTLDECMTLSEHIATAIRSYVRLSPRDRARAAVRDMLPAGVADHFDHLTAMQDATEAMRLHNDQRAKP